MNSPHQTYQQKLTEYQQQLSRVKKKLFASSMVRLALFLLLAFLVYFFFSNTKLVVGVILGGITLFIFLVSRHSQLQLKKKKIEALLEINKTELAVLDRNFYHLDNGEEFKNPQHEFSQDIDLFGERSFFQYLNRTALKSGKQKLANLLTENSIQEIEAKQKAVKELVQKIDFRQEFSAIASIVKTETSSNVIINWLRDYKNFVPKIFRWFPIIFSIISIALISAYFLVDLSGYFVMGWFFVGLAISGSKVKKMNQLSIHVSQTQETFQQYHQLLHLLEKEKFETELLKIQQEKILKEGEKASQLLQKFAKIIDALDQRNNMIFGIFGNGFLLWDLQQSYKLEQWIAQHKTKVENWFAVIEFIDAYNSLGNFAFNHQHYSFPKITSNKNVIKAEDAVHPLINPKDAVHNSFTINNEEFFIITGANMAGKSTFLRTVSLQIMMSNVGLPICAKAAEYSPIKLITSMRTVDSLADEASYFYSELSRLKFIVEKIKTDRYFIILDEILKGTNSTDKAIGSRKFIEKLVRSHSTGIIATHDLSLCEVAEDFSEVKNHYFDAEIINDELHFDYKFKDGICQNMNASFLLRKMEIVDN
ncbi:MutS-related protein [Mesonia maritima]|uniref:DNA mismatch repair ATPase MutS n=1 Tax=Mesonia maritima TaxID=1793873 RepID=A0ABU1K6A5_9FLAO|nr:DNA mismatch repair protein MutS [Mesonia maritima]MDR6300537.1 DNA mismatch repair ATPase MutS [Mesonia maritima]